MNIQELFGELRAALEQPSVASWERIATALDGFEDDLMLADAVIPYLEDRLEEWDLRIPRKARQWWYEEETDPVRKRALARITRVRCPECTDGCSPDQVGASLKAIYGKKYTRVARVRDVMAGKSRVEWSCGACRDQILCPECDEPSTHQDTIQAILEIYGPSTEPRAMVRRLVANPRSVQWACLTCQADGYSLPTVSVPRASRRARPARRAARDRERAEGATYQDRPCNCKVCGAAFVFTANEQRVWFEEYGIPRYVWDLYDRSEVVKARCDACQRVHMAQKRIGEIHNEGLDDTSPEQHEELARLYEITGNEQKANTHRNRAIKLRP